MTDAAIFLPGIEPAMPPGAEEAVVLEPSGFVSKGLVELFLFDDGAGTALTDAKGGDGGVIDNLNSSNNAYSWLDDGGLSLSGAQLASFETFDAASAWTLFAALRVTGHTGSSGVEKIVGLVGLRSYGAAQIRGVYAYQRGPTDLSGDHVNAYYQHRPANGSGGQGTAESLSPTGINTHDEGRVVMISYDGDDTITTTVFNATGDPVATDAMAVTADQLFTVGGVTTSTQQWSLGGLNNVFAGGVVEYVAAGRYARALTDFTADEIAANCEAAAELASERGRAW